MKPFKCFVIICLFTVIRPESCHAQGYIPFLSPNMIRYYTYGSFNVSFDYYYQTLDEDTLINCLLYRKVLCHSDDSIYGFTKYYFMREDTVRRILLLYAPDGEKRIYDFSHNDLFDPINVNGKYYYLTQIEYLNTPVGTLRKFRYQIDVSPKLYDIIEGIGSTIEFISVFPQFSDPSYYLKGAYKNGRLVYTHPGDSLPEYLKPYTNITLEKKCSSDTISFFAGDALGRMSWNWQFKNLTTNGVLASNQKNPVLTFPDTGHYEARLVIGGDTVYKRFHVDLPMNVTFTPMQQTSACPKDTITLSASGNYKCYVWENENNNDFHYTSSFKAGSSGNYIAHVTNNDNCEITHRVLIGYWRVYKSPIYYDNASNRIYLANISRHIFQWYLNGLLLSGETKYFVEPKQNGVYRAFVTDTTMKCSIYSDEFDFTTSGINSPGKGLISIYPNPASDFINIESVSADESIQQISVQNSIGQSLLSISNLQSFVTRLKIPFNELPEGLLILEVKTTKGVYVKKVSIAH